MNLRNRSHRLSARDGDASAYHSPIMSAMAMTQSALVASPLPNQMTAARELRGGTSARETSSGDTDAHPDEEAGNLAGHCDALRGEQSHQVVATYWC
jgi:hypothetical protein